jgi:hypothetical protein
VLPTVTLNDAVCLPSMSAWDVKCGDVCIGIGSDIHDYCILTCKETFDDYNSNKKKRKIITFEERPGKVYFDYQLTLYLLRDASTMKLKVPSSEWMLNGN